MEKELKRLILEVWEYGYSNLDSTVEGDDVIDVYAEKILNQLNNK